MSEEGDSKFVTGNSRDRHHYGTFQGVASYCTPFSPQPPQPVVGFPQPIPPPGSTSHPPFYSVGYQTIPGYAIAEGRPLRERRLPCCGLGMGWFLFIIGFFLGGVPWYVGALVALCAEVDYREKPGYVACAVTSILTVIALALGVTKGALSWDF